MLWRKTEATGAGAGHVLGQDSTDGETFEQTWAGGEGASPVWSQRGRAFKVDGTAIAEVLRPECKGCAWGTIGNPCGWKRGREEGEMHPEESWEGES